MHIPTPGPGQVLIQTKASTICGSDIRCIYKAHTGKGAEGYIPGMIAGHEPCGIIVEEGSNLKRFKKGDRVIVYHISGCGVCYDCRRGYYISCKSEHRKAYGWQRDGGMAPYILAALMIAKALGANQLIGVEMNPYRIELAKRLGLVDHVFEPENAVEEIMKVTKGKGVEKALDASANANARRIAIQATREWGKIVFVGEGGTCTFAPSEELLHGQKTIYGSWVTSLWKMEDLVERLVKWGIHPEDLITHEFPLEKAAEAYALMTQGDCGKVAVVFE